MVLQTDEAGVVHTLPESPYHCVKCGEPMRIVGMVTESTLEEARRRGWREHYWYWLCPIHNPEKESWDTGEVPGNMCGMTREEQVMYNNALYWARVKYERGKKFQQRALEEYARPTGTITVSDDYNVPRTPRPAWVSQAVWWLVICTWAVVLASFANSFLL
jgi:hypothetical protein